MTTTTTDCQHTATSPAGLLPGLVRCMRCGATMSKRKLQAARKARAAAK